MFAAKSAGQPGTLPEASEQLFSAAYELIRQGQEAGVLPPGDTERVRLLLIATLQGIAALINSGRAPAGQADALVADAVALFTRAGPPVAGGP